MVLNWSQIAILFLFSLFLVGSLTPAVRKLAIRLDVIDRPSEAHKTHRSPVPYLGGLAIVIGVVVTIIGAIIFSGEFELFGLASMITLPAIFMGVIGLIDDIRKLNPWPRFLAQNLAGLVIALVLVSTNTLGSPTSKLILDVFISTFWIVGITNSINFFDNVDGGAAGTVAISAFFLFLLAFQGGQYFIAAMSIVLSGATAGFLVWNKEPARIYMGDAGALFLGVLMASLTLRFDPNPIDRLASFTIPVLLLAVPILDTNVVVFSRLKRGISPFQGGKDHLSHRLMNSHLSKRQAVIFLWTLNVLFCIVALLISNVPFTIERELSSLALLFWLLALGIFFAMPSFTASRNSSER